MTISYPSAFHLLRL